MHNSAAARLKVPQPDGTDAKALAQFTALKGSHIKLAVTSTTSPAWNAIAALAKTHGMTVGVNQAGADIDVITTGTTTAMNAGYLANKYDAMASNPPTTSKPDSNIINMGLIQPLASSSGLYLDVLQSFAKKNPATTQKVVNAMVKAWAYAKQNPAKAEQMTTSMQKANEITDPAKIHTLFTDAARGWKTPVLVPEAFDNALKIVNLAQPKPISLTYEKWADPTFVNKAIKDPSLTQGLTVPTTVPADVPNPVPSS
jgi:hypothetical protein